MAENPPETFLIWSEEHGAWWRPHSHGYTAKIAKAGVYGKTEADRICNSANAGLSFCEIAVPVPPGLSELAKLPSGGR